MHWANSPSSNGWGGDGGDFSNDAEVFVYGSSVILYSNDTYGATSLASGAGVDPTSQSTGTAVLCDSYFGWTGDNTGTTIEHTGPETFQIDGNEADTQSSTGLNDQLVYLGVERTVGSTARTGGDVDSLTLIFGL